MNKTVRINLGGFAYNIDENAYEVLSDYLAELKEKLGTSPDATETMRDIEERISELANDKLRGKEVITAVMVDEIIAQLGNPDEIADVHSSDTGRGANSKSRGLKRLYRNPDGSYIAGVCSGMGEYFAVDPLVIRIIFIALMFVHGLGLLVYAIFWIATPRAVTPKQKLEMRGEPVNLQNLGNTIKKEMDDVRENINRSDVKGFWHRLVRMLEQVIYAIFQVFLAFFKVIAIIVGVVLVVSMLFVFVVLVSVMFFGGFGMSVFVPELYGFSLSEFFTSMLGVSAGAWITLPLFLVVAIPVVAIIYGGVRILFKFKARDAVIGGVAAVVWVIAVVLLAVNIAAQGRSFAIRESQQVAVGLSGVSSSNKTIYLNTRSDSTFNDNMYADAYNFFDYSVVKIKGESRIVGKPNLVIVQTSGGEPSLKLVKNARGMNHANAARNASEIIYSYSVGDSAVSIAPYFMLPEGAVWKGQDVSLELCLPVGFAVNIDENLVDIMGAEQPYSSYWPDEMVNKTWRMTTNGLRQVK